MPAYLVCRTCYDGSPTVHVVDAPNPAAAAKYVENATNESYYDDVNEAVEDGVEIIGIASILRNFARALEVRGRVLEVY